MPENQRDVLVTRAAFLELKEEQALVKDGYNLLDEKRILLAQEMRRQLTRLRQLREQSHRQEQAALRALRTALAVHGLDELSVYPPLPPDHAALTMKRRRLLGLDLVDAHLEEEAPPEPAQAVNPSLEAHACALAFRTWQAVLVATAAGEANMRRLIHEYIRTHRRAEALEHVLLPEIEATLRMIDDQLASQDQEETARLRQFRERREMERAGLSGAG
jgi:V/A-type H+-transporting ATPase subunit D